MYQVVNRAAAPLVQCPIVGAEYCWGGIVLRRNLADVAGSVGIPLPRYAAV